MYALNNSNYDISFSDGVVIFKNINTTLGFVRYNQEAEVEYIFVNPIFRRKGLAKKLLQIVEEKDIDIERLSKMALEDPSTGGNPKKLTVEDMRLMYKHSMLGQLF